MMDEPVEGGSRLRSSPVSGVSCVLRRRRHSKNRSPLMPGAASAGSLGACFHIYKRSESFIWAVFGHSG